MVGLPKGTSGGAWRCRGREQGQRFPDSSTAPLRPNKFPEVNFQPHTGNYNKLYSGKWTLETFAGFCIFVNLLPKKTFLQVSRFL